MKLNIEVIKSFGKTSVDLVKKHAPEILTGMGVAGMVATTIFCVKVTPKAMDLIADEQRKRRVAVKSADGSTQEEITEAEQLKPIDYVRVTWKLYLPPVALGVASIACIIGSTSVSLRRNAGLAAAYAITETKFSDYKDKVKELLGDKKEQETRDSIAQDSIKKNPVNKNDIIETGFGETLCYDPMSGRYFHSDIDQIKRSLNYLNHQMLYDESVTLNDLYDILKLDPTKLGEDFGWNMDRNGLIEPSFSSQLADDGTPCVVLDFIEGPFYTGYLDSRTYGTYFAK